MLKETTLKFFRKSHRNIGLVLSIFLLLVSVTGILLNHTQELALDQHSVPAFIAGRYYSNRELSGYQVEHHFYYTIGLSLYVDGEEIAQCSDLEGATRFNRQWVILCDGELFLFTETHELIERMGSVYGLPENLIQLFSSRGGPLLVGDGQQAFSFDPDSLQLQSIGDESVKWPELARIPDELLLGESISWQTFVLDIHSGMFLGSSGKWFTDLLAVFIMLMILSGLVMWRNPR